VKRQSQDQACSEPFTPSPSHPLTPSSDAEAPLGWAYALFPLQGEGDERLSLEWLTGLAHKLIDNAEETGDEAHFGPVLHWAHILKTEQGPDGDWPAQVNARTGAPVGAARTREPARLLARLDALLDSSEFEAVVARAAEGGRETTRQRKE